MLPFKILGIPFNEKPPREVLILKQFSLLYNSIVSDTSNFASTGTIVSFKNELSNK